MIKLKCENCGGELEVNCEQDKIFCNYCGAKVLIDDEASEIRRVENAKLEARKKNHEQSLKEKKELDEIEEIDKFKKGKLSKIVIIFAILCLLFAFTAFNDGKIISGIIGILQVVCFSLSWIFGMQIIKEKFKGMYKILMITGFALIIPFLSLYGGSSSYSSSTECDNIDWSNINLNEYLVEYDNPVGEQSINSDDSFVITLCNVNKEQYRNYLKKTKKFGYTIDSTEYGDNFSASSETGYNISLSWLEDDKELHIRLYKNTEADEKEIKDENTTSKEIKKEDKKKEETKKEEDNNTSSTINNNGIRSDFKNAMDSYEKYMDEYIIFMNKLNDNPSDAELLMEYTKVMKKYNKAMNDFDKWKDNNLNDAETQYYIEVQTRVNQKLTEASLQ